jgi:predicted transcriptional regulator
MSVITLRLPDDKHERLRQLAEGRGVSVNRLLDELTTMALTQHDVEAQFRAMAARGSAKKALAVLDKLDRHYGT